MQHAALAGGGGVERDGGWQNEALRPLRLDEIDRHVAAAASPLVLKVGDGVKEFYGSAPWPARLERQAPAEGQVALKHDECSQGRYQLREVLLCILAPPLVFVIVAECLTFRFHFDNPRLAWAAAALGLLPLLVAHLAVASGRKRGVDSLWLKLLSGKLAFAFFSAAVSSEVNFWYCMYPFYSLQGMRSYASIDPSEVSGARLMDAGKVRFVKGTRVVTDLGMSFTAWDVYCVAPISTPAGLPSQGSQLLSYDFWAVGVGCCSSGQPDWRCGEGNNTSSRGGLRLLDGEQLPYFLLAVQQAEAAYGLRANHPVFFYWVEDPDAEESLLFEFGFKNWIFACSMHFVVNVIALLINILAFHKSPRARYPFAASV